MFEEGEVVGVGIEEDADDSEAGIRTCGCGTAAAYVIAALIMSLVIIMGAGVKDDLQAECFIVRSLLTLSAWNRESAEQVQSVE